MPVISRHRQASLVRAASALCWSALVLSVVWYARVSFSSLHQPFHVGFRELRFFDLRVYRGGAERVVNNVMLYGRPIARHLGFTYPPVTALVFLPLSLASLAFDERAVTAINIVLLWWTLRRTLLIWRSSSRRARPLRAGAIGDWSIAAVAAALALWLEPITTTLGYGQIDLLITALVVFDLSRPDSARSKGAAIGLAAGLKLTPLVFIPYLLLCGRRRAALVSLSAFAATVVCGFAILPRDAARYWDHVIFNTGAVGRISDATNASLQGVIARLTGASRPGVAAMMLVAAVAAVAIVLAARASRRGDDATGFSMCAIGSLLASPVSWTHHWALAVPALLLLVLSAFERRSLPRLLVAVFVAAVGFAYLPQRVAGPPRIGGMVGALSDDAYVILGLIAIAWVGAALAQDARRRSRVSLTDRARRPSLV